MSEVDAQAFIDSGAALAEVKRLYDALPSQLAIHCDDQEALENWRVLVRDYVPKMWALCEAARELMSEQAEIITAWEQCAPDRKDAVVGLLKEIGIPKSLRCRWLVGVDEAAPEKEDNKHREHRVASFSPERDYLFCFDCRAQIDPSAYSSLFAHGKPPLVVMDFSRDSAPVQAWRGTCAAGHLRGGTPSRRNTIAAEHHRGGKEAFQRVLEDTPYTRRKELCELIWELVYTGVPNAAVRGRIAKLLDVIDGTALDDRPASEIY